MRIFQILAPFLLISTAGWAKSLQCSLLENVAGVEFHQVLVVPEFQKVNIETFTHTYMGSVSYLGSHVRVRFTDLEEDLTYFSVFNIGPKPKSFLLVQSQNGNSLQIKCLRK